MAKRRERTVDNPLRLDHVEAIGRPPSADPAEDPPARPLSSGIQNGTADHRDVEPKPVRRDPERTGAAAAAVKPFAEADGGGAPKPAGFQRRDPTRFVQRAAKRDGAKDTHQFKTRFSPNEAAEIEGFRRGLESRLQVKLNWSQLSRALWTLALRAEDELDAVSTPSLSRPAWGDTMSMAEFEDRIAEYLLSAIKKTRR